MLIVLRRVELDINQLITDVVQQHSLAQNTIALGDHVVQNQQHVTG